MKKIITTVGTSLLSNAEKAKFDVTFYKSLTNKPYSRLNDEDVQERLPKIKRELDKYLENTDTNLSAEIASIVKIKQEIKEDIEVYLIATDTVLAPLCAEYIFKFLVANEFLNSENIHIKIIIDLQVRKKKEFEKYGIPSLVEYLNINTNQYDTIYNITGGYKAIIPYMTIIGQINQVPIYYIFEENEQEHYELIKIPQAPFEINWQMFEKYSQVIKDLKNGLSNWSEYKNKHNIEDDFSFCIYVDENDNTAFLNGIGELFEKKYNQWLMVWVIIKGPFLNDAANKNRKILNQAIDGLFSLLNEFIEKNGLKSKNQSEIYNAIKKNGGDNLNHASKGNSDYFICKYPSSSPEIRILYSFQYENDFISRLIIYDFRIGGFAHSQYVDEFHNFYKNNSDKDLIPFLQLKY